MIITLSKVRPKYIRTPLQNVLTSATSYLRDIASSHL